MSGKKQTGNAAVDRVLDQARRVPGPDAATVRLTCLEHAVRFAGGSPDRAVAVAAQFEGYVRDGLPPAAPADDDAGESK